MVVKNNIEDIDKIILENLKNWTIERIDKNRFSYYKISNI